MSGPSSAVGTPAQNPPKKTKWTTAELGVKVTTLDAQIGTIQNTVAEVKSTSDLILARFDSLFPAQTPAAGQQPNLGQVNTAPGGGKMTTRSTSNQNATPYARPSSVNMPNAQPSGIPSGTGTAPPPPPQWWTSRLSLTPP